MHEASKVSLTGLMRSLRGARWAAVLGAVVLLATVFSLLTPAFLQVRNLQNIAAQASVTGVMAVGMTFVILIAGIDISVGAGLYLSAALTAIVATHVAAAAGMAVVLPYLVALTVGAGLGLLNGLLTTVLRINPLVTTLATLSIFRGVAIHLTRAQILLVPNSVRYFGTGTVLGLGMPFLLVILAVVLGTIVLRYTRFGRYVLAIGSSERSAWESGLPVRKVLIAVYIIAGAFAGMGALIMLGRIGAVQSDMGIGIEFTVITAVVLGGTALSGGRGSIIGSLMGAILLVMVNNGLNLINASPFIYDIVRGSVLAGAVLFDRASTVQSQGLFRRAMSRRNPQPRYSKKAGQ